MKLELENVTAVAVGGTFVEIDRKEELSVEEGCDVVDEDGEAVFEDGNPMLSFTGKDGHPYVVPCNSISAFRLEP